MDEHYLIQSAKNGDIDSFNRLVLEYQDVAYTVAYRITGDMETAADATQEAFISAYRNLRQFHGERFKPWLMRIVTNACYDELRHRQRRPASSIEDLEDPAMPDGEVQLASHADNPEQQAQRNELNRAIQDCISALPDSQRTITVLADIEEYSYQEIADITGIALGTVKSRLSRARMQLRDCLQGARELLPAEYRLINEHDS
jgi:RNA polymerase sigma-70 factor (ECF subfamily)